MPRADLRTSRADYIVPLACIPALLVDLTRAPTDVKPTEATTMTQVSTATVAPEAAARGEE